PLGEPPPDPSRFPRAPPFPEALPAPPPHRPPSPPNRPRRAGPDLGWGQTPSEPLRPLAAAVLTVARPRIPLDRRDDPRLDRVLMDVPQQGERVTVLVDQKRLVPSLKEMPDSPVPPVEELRVGRLQTRHDPRQ